MVPVLQRASLTAHYANQRTEQAEANARVAEQSILADMFMYAYGNLSSTVDLNVCGVRHDQRRSR